MMTLPMMSTSQIMAPSSGRGGECVQTRSSGSRCHATCLKAALDVQRLPGACLRTAALSAVSQLLAQPGVSVCGGPVSSGRDGRGVRLTGLSVVPGTPELLRSRCHPDWPAGRLTGVAVLHPGHG